MSRRRHQLRSRYQGMIHKWSSLADRTAEPTVAPMEDVLCDCLCQYMVFKYRPIYGHTTICGSFWNSLQVPNVMYVYETKPVVLLSQINVLWSLGCTL